MKHVMLLFVISALSACGVETATTAATGAAIKKKEIEEGKRMQDQVKQKIEHSIEQTQQRAEKDGER